MNEITISTSSVPTKFSFKNAKLNELSAKIAEQSAAMNALYTEAKDRAEAINKALAPIFGELLKSKCYKDDGFKSVADFAEQTFGMGKSMAYMLARVGDQFYNDDNEYTKAARDTLSTSKLAEFAGVDRTAIAKAIKDGKLTKDTPLAECREFATAHKKPGKEKIVPTFDLFAIRPAYEGTLSDEWKNGKKLIAEDIIKEELVDRAKEYSGLPFYTSIKLEGDKPSAAQHFIMFSATGVCGMFEYRPHVSKAVTTKGKGKDISSLKDMLAAMSPAERLELLKALDGSSDEDEGNEG